jgi:hypothetical protein
MKRPTAFVIGLFLVGASSAFSQSQVSILSQQASATFGVTSAPIPAVVGAPYSGEQSEEHVQTLADGTHITRSMGTIKTWRDSEGRIRTERPMRVAPRASGGTDSPVIVEISDPVAGVRYTLDIENKVAHRVVAPAAGTEITRPAAGAQTRPAVQPNGGWLTTQPPPAGGILTGGIGLPVPNQDTSMRPEFTSEDLGTQVIEGVVAEGHRQTTTFPVGSQGNDRPIATTSETWMSPELKIVILRKTSDPRSGEDTLKTTNLSRAEPDLALFQPPPDYTIVDETSPFMIHFSR